MLGRKCYLYDLLCDLRNQNYLPENVIIVEQNPDLSKKSELDYLQNEHWPFKIKHHFIHQTGACNARNIALRQVESDWVFLADDDILIGSDFILKATNIIKNASYKAFTFCCYMSGKKPADSSIRQWEAFGSGCSMVKKEILAISILFGFVPS